MFYTECGTPMYVGVSDETNDSIKMICDGVQNKDLFMSLKNLLDAREAISVDKASDKIEENANTDENAKENANANANASVNANANANTNANAENKRQSQIFHRSIYREMMFVTLKSFGQDNIDLTAFDREYRRAFDKLPAKYQSLLIPSDRPPNAVTVLCRKFFRELKI